MAVLACLVFLLTLTLYKNHDPEIVKKGFDVWFQADLPRNFDNMTDRTAKSHYRVTVHPTLSLETFPVVYLISKFTNTPEQAVQIFTAIIASLWFVLLYSLFRVIGCYKTDSLLVSTFGLFSAAAIFWLGVPESYPIGSMSIIACLLVAAYAHVKTVKPQYFVLASAFSLSATITNWGIGLLATFFNNKLSRTIIISIAAFTLVFLLWGIQRLIFPYAHFFVSSNKEELTYTFVPNLARLIAIWFSFFIHTIVMPDIKISGVNQADWNLLSIQGINSYTASSLLSLKSIAAYLWSLLLLTSIWAAIKTKTHRRLKILVTTAIVFQFSLHFVYGEETFLYAMHFLPLLLAIVGLALTGKYRHYILIMVVLLTPLIAINNLTQLKRADQLTQTQHLTNSPRDQVLRQMIQRPNDPWPRGTGHVPLGQPGSVEIDKAYYEPGGSFSPTVGSFGVSIWVNNDKTQEIIATSDNIAMSDIQQSLDYKTPGIKTNTPYYQVHWVQLGLSEWELVLDPVPKYGRPIKTSLVIRGVGPAAGPIHELNWHNNELLINHEWKVSFNKKINTPYFGEEIHHDWLTAAEKKTNQTSRQGWAFAKFELEDNQAVIVKLTNIHKKNIASKNRLLEQNNLSINLPDQRFSDSLSAQIAHIKMGLVNHETRPADPMNYPLAWQRDGAYILSALAKYGELATAKDLAKQFAEQDFFGGFGAEADAPGLAIWSLNTISEQLHDQAFDRWLWPHIKRKAMLIEQMLTTKKNMYHDYTGMVVPFLKDSEDLKRIAYPAENGLIIGKMDHQTPILFVNAVSYMGLKHAAKIAKKLNHLTESKHWDSLANGIKVEWNKAYQDKKNDNERTYMSALWPTWIIDDVPAYSKRLTHRYNTKFNKEDDYKIKPLWTYFEIAEAHQGVYLGDSEHTWKIINYFWNHQSSPGLYTWWEGDGEENSFNRWQNIRGWVKPENVTPHYWTAAEMALMQLDMLVFSDQSTNTPSLVIGAGIPKEWTQKKMQVSGLSLERLTVNWVWENNEMRVVIKGKTKPKVTLGKGFPAEAHLKVSYQN